jgi:hypothetical protein
MGFLNDYHLFQKAEFSDILQNSMSITSKC